MASVAYLRGMEAILSGSVNLGTVTVRAMLTTAAYVENRTTHAFRSDVNGEVPAGAGYATGGRSVAVTVTRDEGTNNVVITFAGATWTAPAGATLVARKLVYYASTGGASTDRLLLVNDFGSDRSAVNQDLAVGASTLRYGV